MDKKLQILIENEKNRAIDLHDIFSSPHEAHSVIKEEFEEITEELDNIKNYMDSIWKFIRCNNFDSSNNTIVIACLEKSAEDLIEECIQLSAIAKQLKNQQETNTWK